MPAITQRRGLCALLFIALLYLGAAQAQQLATASISGSVTDLSGKSVGNVTLTLTNVRQGTTRTFTTQSDGQFSFATLEDASYKLSAGGPSGFAGWEQTINLQVGQVQNIAVRLGVAGSKTSVEVAADMQPAVDASTSVVGGVINAREIENLPLNGRNYLELAYLIPGNAPAPNFDPTKEHTVVISSAGQTGRGGNVTIDGGDNNDDAVGGSLVNIPQDAVQEFQIATNRFSAGLGRSGSTVINVVTKQGSNHASWRPRHLRARQVS